MQLTRNMIRFCLLGRRSKNTGNRQAAVLRIPSSRFIFFNCEGMDISESSWDHLQKASFTPLEWPIIQQMREGMEPSKWLRIIESDISGLTDAYKAAKKERVENYKRGKPPPNLSLIHI